MFIGDGAKLVRDAFALAKEKAPAIIFIDELDGMCQNVTIITSLSHRISCTCLVRRKNKKQKKNPPKKPS